jgi:signal transduction histidine kinase
VEFDMRAVTLADVVRDVVPLMEPQLEAKGLALDATGATDDAAAGVQVSADREKLVQVLLNLLSNAIKFTAPAGRVTLQVETVDVGTATLARLRVHDTGTGIPADRLAAIFEPFVQVGRALNNPHEGTGLGLAISRDLARGMGGDLTVESRVGEGSTFTVTLKRVA